MEALGAWLRQSPHRRLLTMFHEVYQAGPEWSSVFWNWRYQKYLAGRLAKSSDACLTSGQMFAERIRQLGRGKH